MLLLQFDPSMAIARESCLDHRKIVGGGGLLALAAVVSYDYCLLLILKPFCVLVIVKTFHYRI